MVDNMKDTVCNVCGLSCDLLENALEYKDAFNFDRVNGGLLNICVSGGYHSTPGNGDGALDDCTSYTFSICEFCLDYLFTKMIIPPKVQSIHDSHPKEEFRSAAQRVREDEWRKAKEEFEDERFRRAISRKLMW